MPMLFHFNQACTQMRTLHGAAFQLAAFFLIRQWREPQPELTNATSAQPATPQYTHMQTNRQCTKGVSCTASNQCHNNTASCALTPKTQVRDSRYATTAIGQLEHSRNVTTVNKAATHGLILRKRCMQQQLLLLSESYTTRLNKKQRQQTSSPLDSTLRLSMLQNYNPGCPMRW